MWVLCLFFLNGTIHQTGNTQKQVPYKQDCCLVEAACCTTSLGAAVLTICTFFYLKISANQFVVEDVTEANKLLNFRAMFSIISVPQILTENQLVLLSHSYY